MGFNALSGKWLKLSDVSNATKTPITLQTVSSNNQVNYVKYMHRQ
jgi:hypothetical protein